MTTDPNPKHGNNLNELAVIVKGHGERLNRHETRLDVIDTHIGAQNVRLAGIVATHEATVERLKEVRSDIRSAKHWIMVTAATVLLSAIGWLILREVDYPSQYQQQQSISTTSQPEWVDTSQMAAKVGVDTETLRERARAGLLPADAVTRTSERGEWRFRSDAVDQIAAAMRGGT